MCWSAQQCDRQFFAMFCWLIIVVQGIRLLIRWWRPKLPIIKPGPVLPAERRFWVGYYLAIGMMIVLAIAIVILLASAPSPPEPPC